MTVIFAIFQKQRRNKHKGRLTCIYYTHHLRSFNKQRTWNIIDTRIPCVPEKAGTNVCVNISQNISCTLIWLSSIIATSFTKKLQQTPAQLVTYFSRYDPKRKRFCSQLLALFDLNQCFHPLVEGLKPHSTLRVVPVICD